MPPNEPRHHLFINKTRYDATSSDMAGEEILKLAGLSTNEYDLFLVKGEGQSERVMAEQTIHIKSSLHFNAIKKQVNFG